MKQKILAFIISALLLLTACGESASDVSPSPQDSSSPSISVTDEPIIEPSPEPTPVVEVTPEPTPTPYNGPVNPLTGEAMGEDYINDRPIAVMLNNLKQAMPQHGNSQADIIYEVLAEGGITRMLAVYQSVEGVGIIGSVRSARTYYLELALGHDAVFLHAGGSPDAYNKIKSWNVTAFDCVNGPYEGTLFWRDKERINKNGYVHSVVTSGETILELMPTYNVRLQHKDGYTYEMKFVEDGTPSDGLAAEVITVPYSYYKTGVFTYNAEINKYFVEEYDSAYIDGNSGEQVSVTNVIVLKTACKVIPGDDAGRITVDLTSGEGWYACGGKIIPILWEKEGTNGQFKYTTLDGEPLTLGVGNSYVNIIPIENDISF